MYISMIWNYSSKHSIPVDSDNIIILGDFNVANFMNGITDRFSRLLNNFQQFHNLRQYNNIYNFRNCMLDLVFSNIICDIDQLCNPFVYEDRHHPVW